MIRVGIGGWSFEPWRGLFYPPGLPQARELEWAAARLGTIEINGTYYRLQNARTFAGWAASVPDGFVFSVKASRFCTNRTNLAESGEAVARFLASGLVELGDRLGPILWQFMPTKRFDAAEFGAFLELLPPRQGGVALRHAVEVRHESFVCAGFVALARRAGVAVVFADGDGRPVIADQTAPDFAYARLQDAVDEIGTGYDPAALDGWAVVARDWEAGRDAVGLPLLDASATALAGPRDVLVFLINGAKRRAPAAARALMARLGQA